MIYAPPASTATTLSNQYQYIMSLSNKRLTRWLLLSSVLDSLYPKSISPSNYAFLLIFFWNSEFLANLTNKSAACETYTSVAYMIDNR